MPSNLDRHKNDIARLIDIGSKMFFDIVARARKESGEKVPPGIKKLTKTAVNFESTYQGWFSEGCAAFRQIMPERLDEFESHYRPDPKRRTRDFDAGTYTIQDWILGLASPTDPFSQKIFDEPTVVAKRLQIQIHMLRALQSRFESSLFEIRRIVQADLFDSEIDVARELLKNGFGRAAGVVAGVVVEKHLAEVCVAHQIVIRKKAPTVADLNNALKDVSVVDTPTWRSIQRWADIRNVCAHNKGREPREDEVSELIDGAEKLMKTLF
ncbi:MAG: hypothetical protein HYR63_30115 [Proteobacteria bacterium]|nr:hypothetical protein [Pseudomonadota bacterium]MBI3498074.1 hypothetical protein [Pseudomonadota bacterium]